MFLIFLALAESRRFRGDDRHQHKECEKPSFLLPNRHHKDRCPKPSPKPEEPDHSKPSPAPEPAPKNQTQGYANKTKKNNTRKYDNDLGIPLNGDPLLICLFAGIVGFGFFILTVYVLYRIYRCYYGRNDEEQNIPPVRYGAPPAQPSNQVHLLNDYPGNIQIPQRPVIYVIPAPQAGYQYQYQVPQHFQAQPQPAAPKQQKPVVSPAPAPAKSPVPAPPKQQEVIVKYGIPSASQAPVYVQYSPSPVQNPYESN